MRNNSRKLKLGISIAGVLAALALTPGGASANCGGGGVSPAETDICTPTAKARLLPNGMLIPPKSAPPRVKQVICGGRQNPHQALRLGRRPRPLVGSRL